jgi:PAS domain S-box-containing protein
MVRPGRFRTICSVLDLNQSQETKIGRQRKLIDPPVENDRLTSHSSLPTPGGLDLRFCEVMDAAPVMIWVSGKDKDCVWFNKPWLTFTGRRLDQEVGNGWSEGVHSDDFERCIKLYSSHFDARKDFRMQYRLRQHDGEYRWIDDTGIPRYAHDGTFLGYIGSCVDVHDNRKTQTELRRLSLEIAELNRQADAAILAASIAHEIKQPLTAIVSNSSAALRWLDGETPNVERAKATLSNIIHASQRAAEISHSIRAISNKERHTRRAPLNLNELIQEVLTLVETELQSRHIAVQITLNDALPQVVGDRVQLQQVILNLIDNAIEAMNAVSDDSRVLHLTTEAEDGENVRITLQDSGPGIDADNTERIFDRFFSTKSQGMGMGLSICRSIVESHGGRLWVEAGFQRGSVFLISLPVRGS